MTIDDMSPIRIEWSEDEPAVEVTTPDEVDTCLDRIATASSVDQPTIVAIRVHDHRLLLGLGLSESFVQVEHASGEPPYVATPKRMMQSHSICTPCITRRSHDGTWFRRLPRGG
jgi:hypothetical protein